jgi:hypothetical protein
MQSLYQNLTYTHAIAGGLGLLVFWLPLIARLGGSTHKRYGRVFVTAMQITGATAVIMTVLLYGFPIEIRAAGNLSLEQQAQVIAQANQLADLLLPLGLLLLANSRHAVMVLRHKQNREPLKAVSHRLLILALGAASIHLLLAALSEGGVLQWVFALLGLSNAVGMWRYIHKLELRKGEWLKAHIGNILGAGIGAHTAFLVFGGNNLIQQWVSPDLQTWLWIAPSVIGGLGIAVMRARYSRRVA